MKIDLKMLSRDQGFKILGATSEDVTGIAVSGAGDVNADGMPDMIVGAPAAGATERSSSGSAYIVYGQKLGKDFGDIDLNNLSPNQGFKILGENNTDWAGISVSNAKDINGDRIDDIIMGASLASPLGRKYSGISYVIYGKKGGYKSIELSDLDNTQGFKIIGASSKDQSGAVVSSAGDVNGDGIADVAIGAAGASPFGRDNGGESYVIYGKKGGYDTIDLNGTLDRNVGFKISGAHGGKFGMGDLSYIISGVGDINKDGIDDVAIGAFNAHPLERESQGLVHVLYGVKGIRSDIDLLKFNNTQGFRILAADDDRFGGAVANAGDVNADGISDIIIGAYEGVPLGRFQAGISYVIYGKKGGYSDDIDLLYFNRTHGFKILGEANSCSGGAVAGAGDINSDGIDDVAIGAFNAAPFGRSEAGAGYVVYGKKGGYIKDVDLSNLTDDGFGIFGAAAKDNAGQSLSGVLDINGDGVNDIIVGAPGVSLSGRSEAGVAYVIYGSDNVDKSNLSSVSPVVIVTPPPKGAADSEVSKSWVHDHIGLLGGIAGTVVACAAMSVLGYYAYKHYHSHHDIDGGVELGNHLVDTDAGL